MSEDQQKLLGAALLALFFLGVGCLWLVQVRRRVLERLSVPAFVLMMLVTLALLGTPVAWQCSLLPHWTNLNSPAISGIGGGLYGLDYTWYIKVTVFYFAHWLAFAVCAVIALGLVKPIHAGGDSGRILMSLRMLLTESPVFEFVAYGAVAILFVVFFTGVGWGRIWYSEGGRFDGLNSVAGFGALLGVIKIVPFLLLLFGIASSFLLALGSRPLLASLFVVVAMVPSIVMASRTFAIIWTCAYLALVYRSRKAFKICGLLLMPLALAYGLLIPLRLRSFDYTGCSALLEANLMLMNEILGGRNPFLVASNVLSNLSQGFPVMAEVFAMNEAGSVLSGVPPEYLWLSFSPTLSVIDGFAGRWMMFGPRVNRYTPFSSLAELYGISYAFSVFFVALVYSLFLVMISGLGRRRGVGGAASWIVVALALLSVFLLQQYQIRTFMRTFYMAVAIYGFFRAGYGLGIFEGLERRLEYLWRRRVPARIGADPVGSSRSSGGSLPPAAYQRR